MTIHMDGKVALVTGAGSGIGQVIATYLAKAGAKVMTVERTETTLKETAVLHENITYPLGEISLQEYDTTFTTNVRAVIDLTQQALPLLKASKGNVVNISSTAAEKPIPNMSVYSASKAAMSALTKSWAKELAKDGIRFNNVIVGPIETPIYDKTALSDEGAQKHREFVLGTIPMGHYGEPDDVAAAVLFLASKEAKFITGADCAVDGGVRA